MTWSTSDVAVCCSSDSVSSRVRCCSASNSRTFSMAITAWSAKVSASSICLSVEGPNSILRARSMTPIGDPSRRSGTPRSVRDRVNLRLAAVGISVFGIGQNVENMDDFAFKHDAPEPIHGRSQLSVTCEELGVFPASNAIARYRCRQFRPSVDL